MKKMSKIYRYMCLPVMLAVMTSCDDYLDKQPPSYIVPEDYYRQESQIEACVNKFYTEDRKSVV